ncbi:hypothetical protein C8J56DRAFT_455418 [Mycena floridula]|nr:hypothetical protein C8J56DRAFT_455418 [Mycena floridula]
MPKILVVGASRGIGFALANEFDTRPGVDVIAAIRSDPVGSLSSSIQTINVDITDDVSVASVASQIPELDILIVNAGMGGPEKLLSTPVERLREYFETNTLGTHRVVQALLPALRNGKEKKIIIMSSQSGSLEKQRSPSRFGLGGPYGVSKAASNMLAVQYHNELNNQGGEGFVVVPLHPGWVATDIGKRVGDGGEQPQVRAKDLVDLILKLGIDDSARFVVWDGSILPW